MNSPYMTTPSSSQGARIVGEGLSDTSGPGPELMTAATLTGNTVVNTADETLGKIEEIMLDVPGGRIAYAGPPAEVLTDDAMEAVFGCRMRINGVPASGVPFVLPHTASA